MALASEILARAHEKSKGPYPDMNDKEVVAQFLKLDSELGLMATLRGLNVAKKSVTDNKNTILVFSKAGDLEIKSYRDATEALRALFELESRFPDRDIVLVRADKSEEIRVAFRNYFSDATEFIRLVEDGCAKLSGVKHIPIRPPRRRCR